MKLIHCFLFCIVKHSCIIWDHNKNITGINKKILQSNLILNPLELVSVLTNYFNMFVLFERNCLKNFAILKSHLKITCYIIYSYHTLHLKKMRWCHAVYALVHFNYLSFSFLRFFVNNKIRFFFSIFVHMLHSIISSLLTLSNRHLIIIQISHWRERIK